MHFLFGLVKLIFGLPNLSVLPKGYQDLEILRALCCKSQFISTETVAKVKALTARKEL